MTDRYWKPARLALAAFFVGVIVAAAAADHHANEGATPHTNQDALAPHHVNESFPSAWSVKVGDREAGVEIVTASPAEGAALFAIASDLANDFRPPVWDPWKTEDPYWRSTPDDNPGPIYNQDWPQLPADFPVLPDDCCGPGPVPVNIDGRIVVQFVIVWQNGTPIAIPYWTKPGLGQ